MDALLLASAGGCKRRSGEEEAERLEEKLESSPQGRRKQQQPVVLSFFVDPGTHLLLVLPAVWLQTRSSADPPAAPASTLLFTATALVLLSDCVILFCSPSFPFRTLTHHAATSAWAAPTPNRCQPVHQLSDHQSRQVPVPK